ncbi:hypothetical protein GS501_04550 [Saccharibacter sp. 17.LH.SD]|uniref:hypothetical protein n=1 Tax=Saccharibacter sp. 17.LH.SD TaxID=2689393 RepID=UPI00136933AB|nr:hypothetical protein [Saccharibacter sp. 17.LH.SD]MXV44315.1 hypothetical protein [Saccharibacter sp. 17.LH.SD]
MSAGTVALVFVTIASLPTSTGTPTTYERHIIPAGASTEPVAEAPGVNSEVAWAFQKIVRSSNRSGYLTDNDLAKAPMKNTLASCNAYARQKIPLFEEAAEQQEGTTIADYRCLYIPAGYKLIDYSRPYDMSNIRHIVPLNPYRMEKIPEAPVEPPHTGPECLYVRPQYPQDAQEEDREGRVDAYCDSVKGPDNYYYPKNCQIVKEKGGKDFGPMALEFWQDGGGCSAKLPPPAPVPGKYVYYVDYILSYN